MKTNYYHSTTGEKKVVIEDPNKEPADSDEDEHNSVSNAEIANYYIESNDYLPLDQKRVMMLWNNFVCSKEALSFPCIKERKAYMIEHFIRLHKEMIIKSDLKSATLLFLVNNVLYNCISLENLYRIWTIAFPKLTHN